MMGGNNKELLLLAIVFCLTENSLQMGRFQRVKYSGEPFCFAYNYNFLGNTFTTSLADSHNECQRHCQDNPNCVSFAWSSDGVADVGSRRECRQLEDLQGGSSALPGVVSGPRTCCYWNHKGLLGYDLHNHPGVDAEVQSAAECHWICKSDQYCSLWAWVSHQTFELPSANGHCYLKIDSGLDFLIHQSQAIMGPKSCQEEAGAAEHWNNLDPAVLLESRLECAAYAITNPACDSFTYDKDTMSCQCGALGSKLHYFEPDPTGSSNSYALEKSPEICHLDPSGLPGNLMFYLAGFYGTNPKLVAYVRLMENAPMDEVYPNGENSPNDDASSSTVPWTADPAYPGFLDPTPLVIPNGGIRAAFCSNSYKMHLRYIIMPGMTISSFTIMNWRFLMATTSPIIRFYQGLGNDANYGPSITYKNDGRMDIELELGATKFATDNPIVNLFEWHNAAVTFDLSTNSIKVYTNGVLIQSFVSSDIYSVIGNGVALHHLDTFNRFTPAGTNCKSPFATLEIYNYSVDEADMPALYERSKSLASTGC